MSSDVFYLQICGMKLFFSCEVANLVSSLSNLFEQYIYISFLKVAWINDAHPSIVIYTN